MNYYPYTPDDQTVSYVGADNPFMQQARAYAHEHSLDDTMPNASVIIHDDIVIGSGANGSTYHKNHVCERVKKNIPTGQGYELCEGCNPKNHSEQTAIRDAVVRGNKKQIMGSDLYLWGHWWCCKSCWDAMISVGIKNVFLLKDSEILFNKDHQNNIVGHQFDNQKPLENHTSSGLKILVA